MSGLQNVQRLLPKLHSGLRKGACGKIGIIGGSAEYTGAPYFAAMSAVKLGADLIHVFCPAEAAPVIKGYSPELMVHPSFDDEKALFEKLSRLDAIVIGPGLGRDPQRSSLVKNVLKFAHENQLPTVIDADGLWFLCDLLDTVRNFNTLFLTPNTIEFHRLVEKATGESDLERYNKEPDYVKQKAKEFVNKTGLAIYLKGKDDLVLCPKWEAPVCGKENGSPRRCGGQGDLTAGTLGVFYLWAKKKFEQNGEAMKYAGMASHELVRMAAKMAFEKFGRSMTASDMIEQICPIVMKLDN